MKRSTRKPKKEASHAEPHITINGITLTSGQAMTMRCALETFALSLNDGLGNDEHGRFMVRAYRERVQEIRLLIFGARS